MQSRWQLRSLVLFLVVLILAGGLRFTFAENWNLQNPPRNADIERLETMDPQEAATELLGALMRHYRPATGTQRGSSSNPNFRRWVDLAAWLSLLAMTESEARERYLTGRVWQMPGEDRPTHFPPGHAIPPEAMPASRDWILSYAKQDNAIWDSTLPAGESSKEGRLESRLSPGLRSWVLHNPEALRAFLSILSPTDFLPLVFSHWNSMVEADEDARDSYLPLALALAVVFDEPWPRKWPHHQVEQSSVPFSDDPLPERFAQWKKANESGRLYYDLRSLEADQLRFVIDVPLEESELVWARANARFPRSDFGRAFSSIRYDHARLKEGQFKWPPETPYTLEEIKERGGICVDQAYFAMISGKAHGLPTLYFVGQGQDGGHAWFGYMRGMDRWEMDCGRYENQNYAVGEALDPQTWRPITDHEIDFLARRFRRTDVYQASSADLLLASLLADAGKEEEAATAMRSAMASCRQNHEAWLTYGQSLSGLPPLERASFWQEAAAAFPNSRQIQTDFWHRSLIALQEAGDVAGVRQLEDRIIALNRVQRPDLSVQWISDRLQTLMKEENLDPAYQYFRTEIGKMSRYSGGDLFYKLVRPLARAYLDQGDPRGAKRVIDVGRRQLSPRRDSILDQELQSLANETGL
jgi:hypothetical protein